jgi:Protein of unknown function (DUF1552)
MAKMILSRRAVLRGALAGGGLATLPLPRLAAMLNGNGTAYAAGEPLRRVYGTWFWANGVYPTRWTPKTEGANFELSEQLMPFANVRRHLTVISRMAVKTGRSGPHLYHGGALTGSAGANKQADLPSIDQLIAGKIGADTPLPSLEVGVCKARPTGTAPLYYNVSWRGANAPNPADFDPHSVFTRLFGAGSPGAMIGKKPTTPAPDTAGITTVRKSVLDAITQDARDLSVRVGSEDRQRLEKHLEGIRSLEKRLAPGPGVVGAGCQPAGDPGVPPDTKAEAPPELNKAMADLVVAALSCDLTRVFTFTFNYAGAHLYFRNLGPALSKDFHTQIAHGEGGDQPNFNIGVLYTMRCWAYLLEQMDKVEEGAGTLLDNALVYGSTCVGWGKAHSSTNWPVMIFGRAGGALKGNFHYAAPPDDNVSKVALTIGNVFGLGLKEFGKGAGLVSEEVPSIRA